MMNGRNSGSDREATLRRVAIVLSSLPASVASQLLGAVGPESKQALRRTMTTLADVDPLERRRALQAFKVSVQQQPEENPRPVRSSSDRAPAFDSQSSTPPPPRATSTPTSRVVASTSAESREPQADSSPLSFLGDVDDDTLVGLLAVEHPQAVALVLASIAPAQAARVLPRLDAKVRSESLSRIGRLAEIPEAAVAEVAEHFKARLAQQPTGRGNTTGKRALDAILAALPASSTAATEPEPQAMQPPHAINFPSADVPAIDLTHKLRVAQGTWPDPADAFNHDWVASARSHSTPQQFAAETPVRDSAVPDSPVYDSPVPDSAVYEATSSRGTAPAMESGCDTCLDASRLGVGRSRRRCCER